MRQQNQHLNPCALDMLRQAVAGARTAMPYIERTPVGLAEPTHRIPKLPVAGTRIALGASLPNISRSEREGFEVGMSGKVQPGGETVSLKSAVMASSRVIQAGAHLIKESPARKIPTSTPNVPTLQLVPSGLRLVKPAKLTPVQNEDPIPHSEFSTVIKEAKTQRSEDLKLYSFRTLISRRDQKDVEDDRLLSEALHAITMGVGRAVDVELLNGISTAREAGDETAQFALHRAAAAGVKFGELSALVGSDIFPTSTVSEGGKLFFRGIPAELTDVGGSVSFIAAWSRFGVVISDHMEILVQRTSPDGSVILTVWIGLKAAIPDINFAWLS